MLQLRLPQLKRLFLLALTAAMVGIGLSGCGRGGQDQVTIRFWNGFTGPDGRTMLAMVRKFNEENPDVRVVMQRMAWNTYYNKLFVAGLGGRAPELFVLQTDAFTRFQRADFIQPLNAFIEGEYGLDMSDFDDNVIETVLHNGEYFAIPLDAYILGMYYNRDLFRRAGIVDEYGEPLAPTTREDFLLAARRIRDLGRTELGDTWGFVFAELFNNLYGIATQFGAEFFSEDGREVTINAPENVAAVEFALSLIQEHRVAPPIEAMDSWIGFRQGRVGMVFQGIYMMPDLERQQTLDFGAAPIPTFGPQRGTWMGSHNLCMSVGLDEREAEAAWRFMRFLSDNSLDWAEGGQVPVRKSLRETERFQEMYAQSQFAKQLEYAQYVPANVFVFEYLEQYNLALERALRARTTPQQALDEAAANIREIMRRYGITPREDDAT
ncbi:MAG: ABC transporter substrate-binding protein [Opitutales bacterium]|nr:ABC transporter substrate-binding protein [Opitutales bacterium]